MAYLLNEIDRHELEVKLKERELLNCRFPENNRNQWGWAREVFVFLGNTAVEFQSILSSNSLPHPIPCPT